MPQSVYILITSLCTLLFAYYSYVVVLAYMGLKSIRKTNVPETYQPKVTILVAFRNEADNLRNLLKDIAKQYYPTSKIELILVNDRSTPAQIEKTKAHVQRTSVTNITLLHNSGAGKKMALAEGIYHAKHDFVLQTDADCRLPDTWVTEMTRPFAQVETNLVMGSVVMRPTNSFWSKFAALDFLSLQAVGIGHAAIGKAFMGSGANMAYRKSAWLAHEEYQITELSGDDTHLIQALAETKKPGIRIAEPSTVSVTTAAPNTLLGFINQRVRWGAKTKNYTSLKAKVIAVVVFLLNAFLLGIAVGGILLPALLPFVLCLFISKLLLDLVLLMHFAQRTNQRKTLSYYPVISLLYPLYILSTTAIILFFPAMARWKGDKLTKTEA